MSQPPQTPQFVSRGGHKLAAALDAFQIDVNGLVCADLGSHVGGFVDCLLQRGADRVYSVDTSYGTLAWRLRKNPRVVVMERCNAMHVSLPETVDLVTIDVGWTPQHRVLPHALTLLRPGGSIVTLLKPHYEAKRGQLVNGVLPEAFVPEVLDAVLTSIAILPLVVRGTIPSPLPGHGGNREFFAHLQQSG